MTSDIHQKVAGRVAKMVIREYVNDGDVTEIAAILKEEYGPILVAVKVAQKYACLKPCGSPSCDALIKLRAELSKKGLL